MRTWLHALPPAHHALEASFGGFRRTAAKCEKARSGAGFGAKHRTRSPERRAAGGENRLPDAARLS